MFILDLIKENLDFVKFGFVGLLLIVVDSILYYSMLNIGLSISMSKGFAYIVGIIISFTLNKLWTFRKIKFSYLEIFKFILLYFFTLIVNVSINNLIIYYTEFYILAYFVSVVASSLINFFVQKYLIFH